jgi:hypothetical protein
MRSTFDAVPDASEPISDAVVTTETMCPASVTAAQAAVPPSVADVQPSHELAGYYFESTPYGSVPSGRFRAHPRLEAVMERSNQIAREARK